MLREVKNDSVKFTGNSYVKRINPIESWLWDMYKPFDGDSFEDFLEWICQQRVTLAPDFQVLKHMPQRILWEFASAWDTDSYHDGFTKNGWLRYAGYMLNLRKDGKVLTVRRGNKYHSLIDTHGVGFDWFDVGAGLKRLGQHGSVIPASVGTFAAGYVQNLGINAEMVPGNVRMLAWAAFKGGRMQGLKYGHSEGYSYDLGSAYPAAASELPDCQGARCEWVESTDYHADAFYGFAEIEVNIPKMIAGPLAFRSHKVDYNQGPEESLSFPVGKSIKITVSKPEMELLQEMEISFTIHNAVWGYPDKQRFPFKRLMYMLYSLRQYCPAGGKSIAVASVGQLCMTLDSTAKYRIAGRCWQPVYAAHAYAKVRCEVYRKALQVGMENVIGFCIDNVITEKRIKAGSGGMGKWRLESEGSYFLAGDYFKDRPGETGYQDMIKETPESTPGGFFSMPITEYVSLRSVMGQSRPFGKLGQTVSHNVQIPLPKGQTRESILAK